MRDVLKASTPPASLPSVTTGGARASSYTGATVPGAGVDSTYIRGWATYAGGDSTYTTAGSGHDQDGQGEL